MLNAAGLVNRHFGTCYSIDDGGDSDVWWDSDSDDDSHGPATPPPHSGSVGLYVSSDYAQQLLGTLTGSRKRSGKYKGRRWTVPQCVLDKLQSMSISDEINLSNPSCREKRERLTVSNDHEVESGDGAPRYKRVRSMDEVFGQLLAEWSTSCTGVVCETYVAAVGDGRVKASDDAFFAECLTW